jgi:hypothetical protein
MIYGPVRMVYGAAAFGFDPSGASLAFIAPKAATAPAIRLSLGPLRILDPGTGAVRTLLDAAEIAFFWAQDGKTIAVLQVDLSGGGGLASANAVLAASASPAAPDPGFGLHLRFVKVASGAIRSERQVLLSDVRRRPPASPLGPGYCRPIPSKACSVPNSWSSSCLSILPLFRSEVHGRARWSVSADIRPVAPRWMDLRAPDSGQRLAAGSGPTRNRAGAARLSRNGQSIDKIVAPVCGAGDSGAFGRRSTITTARGGP